MTPEKSFTTRFFVRTDHFNTIHVDDGNGGTKTALRAKVRYMVTYRGRRIIGDTGIVLNPEWKVCAKFTRTFYPNGKRRNRYRELLEVEVSDRMKHWAKCIEDVADQLDAAELETICSRDFSDMVWKRHAEVVAAAREAERGKRWNRTGYESTDPDHMGEPVAAEIFGAQLTRSYSYLPSSAGGWYHPVYGLFGPLERRVLA